MPVRELANALVEDLMQQELFLRKAIIVDVDGTIAHREPGWRAGVTPRDPYDMTRVVEDAYDPIIGDIAQRYNDDYYIIIIISYLEYN